MDIYRKYYEKLPVGIMIINPKIEPIYTNSAYEKILDFGSAEFGSTEKTQAEILESLQKQKNKSEGVIRFLDEKGKSSFVFQISTWHLDEHSQIVCLIPVTSNQKFFVAEFRETYIHGLLRINLSGQTVKYGRSFVPVSEIEFSLLEFLVKNEDRLVSKSELLNRVWGNRSLETRTVDISINRLRTRLKNAGCKQDYIKTIHGRGYCFVSEPEKPE